MDAETGKRVSWAELYFDLVFVVAVTRVSALVEHDHTWPGLLRALIVFVPVYWVWVGAAVQSNQQDTERVPVRLRLFAVALAAVFMAVALGSAYDRLGLLFACAYWAGRFVLAAALIPALRRRQATIFNPPVVSVVVSGPLLVIGALFDGAPRAAVWAAAAVLDLATPSLFRRRMAGMHFDAGHLAERFGLLVLIALGESVVAVATSSTHVDTSTGFAIAAAFVLSCGLWWVYFQFAADAMRHSLAIARVQLDVTRLVLSYGHLAFLVAIILVAVGLHGAISAPTAALGWTVAGLLYGGAALYLAGFGFTRWAMFRLVSWTRLGAAVVVLAVLPVAPYLPALAALALLGLIVVLLNAFELARVEQIGWRARLRLRGRQADLEA